MLKPIESYATADMVHFRFMLLDIKLSVYVCVRQTYLFCLFKAGKITTFFCVFSFLFFVSVWNDLNNQFILFVWVRLFDGEGERERQKKQSSICRSHCDRLRAKSIYNSRNGRRLCRMNVWTCSPFTCFNRHRVFIVHILESKWFEVLIVRNTLYEYNLSRCLIAHIKRLRRFEYFRFFFASKSTKYFPFAPGTWLRAIFILRDLATFHKCDRCTAQRHNSFQCILRRGKVNLFRRRFNCNVRTQICPKISTPVWLIV